MSKSDLHDYSRINLTDEADLIFKKIKKAKTDLIPQVYIYMIQFTIIMIKK